MKRPLGASEILTIHLSTDRPPIYIDDLGICLLLLGHLSQRFCIMGDRLCLRYLVRMYKHCRLLPHTCIYQKAYTYEYKRNTQQLPHIENHSLLEIHLWLLDKLNKESHSKTYYEENADKHPPIHLLKPVFVKGHEDNP